MALTEDGALLKRVALELLRLIEESQVPVQPPLPNPPPVVPPVPPVPPAPPVVPTIAFEPTDLGKLKEKDAGQGVKAALTVKTTGIDAFDWTVVRGYEPWHWRHYPPMRAVTSGSVRIEPVFFENGDFVKVFKADNYEVNKETARVVLEQIAPPPPPPPQPGGAGPINIMVRGQSNALLFCDFGGVYVMRDAIQAATGRRVNVFSRWADNGPASIWSGTPFLSHSNEQGWAATGRQEMLRQFHANLSPAEKAAPFIELWMHNESDMKHGPSTEQWVAGVREDAGIMRRALGLGAAQCVYYFVPIRYNYGDIGNILNGMKQFAADPSFNAVVSMAAWAARMDYEPERPNSEHMSRNDANLIGRALGQEIASRYPRA